MNENFWKYCGEVGERLNMLHPTRVILNDIEAVAKAFDAAMHPAECANLVRTRAMALCAFGI